MKRKIVALIVAVLLGGGATLAVATPAYAYPFEPCHGAGVVCFAEHINGEGAHWGPVTLRPYGTCFSVPSWLNDKISSLWNKYGIDGTATLPVILYRNGGCAYYMYAWGPGAYVLNIGSVNNDKASSACVGLRAPSGSRPEGFCPRG